MGVFLMLCCMALLLFLRTVDSSDNQLALLFRKTGFFNKLRIVLITVSAILGPLSVYNE